MGKTNNPKVSNYPVTTVCPYCGGEVKLLGNEFIYGRKYGNGLCYACLQCKASVGVHSGTEIPLGRLADQATRDLRKQCHALFDPLWKGGTRFKKRPEAYRWLAYKLGIPFADCHISWLTNDQLRSAIAILEQE